MFVGDGMWSIGGARDYVCVCSVSVHHSVHHFDSHVGPFEAHVLTDGLAGAESCMIGIVGLYQKSVRERAFPLSLLKKGLEVKIEEPWREDRRLLIIWFSKTGI